MAASVPGVVHFPQACGNVREGKSEGRNPNSELLAEGHQPKARSRGAVLLGALQIVVLSASSCVPKAAASCTHSIRFARSLAR